MSTTNYLNLYKHDNVTTNQNAFDIENYLNGNWDKIDQNASSQNTRLSTLETGQTSQGTRITNLETDNTTNKTNITNLQTEQVTQNNRLTNLETDNTTNKTNIQTNATNITSLQEGEVTQNNRLSTLETDNTTNKTNITNLQNVQTTQSATIQALQAENTRLKKNQIYGTATGTEVEITDSAEMEASIGVGGNSTQEEEPSVSNPSEIKNLTGNTVCKVCNKNLAYPGWAEEFVSRINNTSYAKMATRDNRNCLYYIASAGYRKLR